MTEGKAEQVINYFTKTVERFTMDNFQFLFASKN